MFRPKTSSFRFLVLAVAVALPVAAWAANPYQSRNTHFGVSGGNTNDISRAFCCSGTLGSLVTDGTTKYVLSNNHILARQDQAAVGEDISQPGLIDNGCAVATIVADFTKAPLLGSNVDAALATLRTGTMDSTGFIEGIGVISRNTLNPSVGLAVKKSGRTTGTTTGTIASVNTSVNVQYQKGCGKGKKYVISYTNQVLINSSTFSAGGDSGSLIVSNDAAFHPVALLFAGSSSTTIANPIGEVLSKVGSALGRSISFVGSNTTAPTTTAATNSSTGAEGLQLPQQAVDRATKALETRRHNLMVRRSVLGVGIGASDTNSQEAAIILYVDKTAATRPQLPTQIKGVPVKIHLTDPFVAF
jgi:hypothetical protein